MANKMAPDVGPVGQTMVSLELRQSRVVRKAAQRNLVERIAELEQQRHLDTQRRQTQAQLDRDQKLLRAQLRRLQNEQRLLAEDESFEVKSDICPLADDEEDVECFQECINPYPIVFPSTARSGSSSGFTSGRRREGDETDNPEPSTRTLPRIRSTSRTQASGSPSNAAPYPDPRQAESARSPASAAGAADDAAACWLGDPEAIQSVRRPRKSVARLKLEHRWNRSQSLKERAVSRAETPKRAAAAVVRSKSMRESSGAKGGADPGLTPPTSWSRSNSLKEQRPLRRCRRLVRSIECLNASIGQINVTSPEGRLRRMRVKSSGQSPTPEPPAECPEVRQAGWCSPSDALPEVQPGSRRRVSPALVVTTAAPELPPPLPPIGTPRKTEDADDS